MTEALIFAAAMLILAVAILAALYFIVANSESAGITRKLHLGTVARTLLPASDRGVRLRAEG
jgi:hypothetical protein